MLHLSLPLASDVVLTHCCHWLDVGFSPLGFSHRSRFAARMSDFIFYIVLDIGNEALNKIPTGVRILDGFMQSIAVRAAGFAIVPLGALAPAMK
jgi:Trk-type K+ transport system membrane component